MNAGHPRHRPTAPAYKAIVIAAACTVLLGGCIAVTVGAGDAPPMAYYTLADARPAAASAARGKETLTVHSHSSDPLADSTAIAYSRRAGERSLYQLAAWTERPARRLTKLAQQRLQAGGRFAGVTEVGQPVNSGWLLSLALEDIVHDVSSAPGSSRIAVRAELIDRRSRIRVAERTFSATAPVAEATTSAAVTAFADATAGVLDQITQWVETNVAAHGSR